MSFSSDVKDELVRTITDADKKYSCLYGMLLFCKKLDIGGIVMQTENSAAAKLFSSLVREVFGGAAVVSERPRGEGSSYAIRLSPEDSAKAFSVYRFSGGDPRRINFDMIDNNSFYVFISGAFIVSGSITDPSKGYHLEFTPPSDGLAEDLMRLLSMFGISAKSTTRRTGSVVYIKESENIEDILTMMGAVGSSLELMNVKILKDVRNKANRIANCDSANIDKTILAAERQVEDIELIEKAKGLDFLPPDLRELALLRLENTDVSLRELGEMLEKPIGRSGVNHRINRIRSIADRIRSGEL